MSLLQKLFGRFFAPKSKTDAEIEALVEKTRRRLTGGAQRAEVALLDAHGKELTQFGRALLPSDGSL